MDPIVEAALQPSTLKAYKRALWKFYLWAHGNDVIIHSHEELDDFFCEYKNDVAWQQRRSQPGCSFVVTKSALETLLAAAQKIFPEIKQGMYQTREVLKSWRVAFAPNHTTPMSGLWAYHLARSAASTHGSRKAGLLPPQYHMCLRPTEALRIQRGDLLSEAETTVPGMVGVLLGTRKRTKVRRQQVARSSDPVAVALVNHYKASTSDDEIISGGMTLAQYNAMIKAAMTNAHLTSGKWTAHSPRSGRASDMYLADEPFIKIRETGRWGHDGSLRIYLETASVLCAKVNKELSDARAAALASHRNFTQLFRLW